MILYLLVAFVLLFFLSMNFIDRPVIKYSVAVPFLLLVMACLAAITANFKDEFGMEEKVITKKTEIYPAVAPQPGVNILMYQPVGTKGNDQAIIYRKQATAKKTTVLKPDTDVKNHIKVSKTAQKGYWIQKKTEKVYRSDFYKLLFNGLNNHKVIKTTNTVEVPKTWQVLTTDEMKKLQKQMQEQMKQKMKQMQQAKQAGSQSQAPTTGNK